MFKRITRVAKSRLHDQESFYRAFERDLRTARHRIIIESPFITKRRSCAVLPLVKQVVRRGVVVVVNTRDPNEHELVMREHALECIDALQLLGVTVLYASGLHRKLAILDNTSWEGSLNILSQADSCEMMRRTQSTEYTKQLIQFTKMARWYNNG